MPSKFSQNTDTSIPALLTNTKVTLLAIASLEAGLADTSGQMRGAVNAVDKPTQKQANMPIANAVLFCFKKRVWADAVDRLNNCRHMDTRMRSAPSLWYEELFDWSIQILDDFDWFKFGLKKTRAQQNRYL